MFRVQDDASRAIKRILRQKEPASEKEYKAVVEKKIESEMQEAILQKKYFERFLKILPAKKIVEIFDAEARFSQELMRNKNFRNDKKTPQVSTSQEKK